MRHRAALQDAIAAAGGQAALAAKIGVSQSLISYWLNTSKRGVAAEYAAAVEAITGVPAKRLRPDVFGAKPQPMAEAS